jgi:hypothetical protein
MTPAHTQFLRSLSGIDAETKSATGLMREMTFVCEEVAPRLQTRSRELMADTLHRAGEALSGAPVTYGFSHGDFAPSHTLLNDGEMFVFDWEYGGTHRPVEWDAFNFAVGVAIGRKTSVGLACLGERPSAETKALYLLYLLDMGAALIRGIAGEQSCLKFEPYEGFIDSFLRCESRVAARDPVLLPFL